MTDKHYIVYSIVDDEAEYQIDSNKRDLKTIAAIMADDSRDRAGYGDRWPGDDPEAHPGGAYYIADIDVLRNLAQQYNEPIYCCRYNEESTVDNP